MSVERYMLEMEFEVGPTLSRTQMHFMILDALPVEIPDADGITAAELQEARFLEHSGTLLRPTQQPGDQQESGG